MGTPPDRISDVVLQAAAKLVQEGIATARCADVEADQCMHTQDCSLTQAADSDNQVRTCCRSGQTQTGFPKVKHDSAQPSQGALELR